MMEGRGNYAALEGEGLRDVDGLRKRWSGELNPRRHYSQLCKNGDILC